MSRANAQTRVAVGAGLVALGLSVAALAGLTSFQLAGGQLLIPLSQSLDQTAEGLLNADPSRARDMTAAALALRPVDAEAWLRLARLEEAAHPLSVLSPEARFALARSYAAGPYASGLLESRVQFAFDHWSGLGGDLQAQTTSEVKAAWPVAPQHQRLLAVASRVKDPTGALALSGLLFSLRLSQDLDAAARRAAQAPVRPTGG
jgi:hypothetical protein